MLELPLLVVIIELLLVIIALMFKPEAPSGHQVGSPASRWTVAYLVGSGIVGAVAYLMVLSANGIN